MQGTDRVTATGRDVVETGAATSHADVAISEPNSTT